MKTVLGGQPKSLGRRGQLRVRCAPAPLKPLTRLKEELNDENGVRSEVFMPDALPIAEAFCVR